MTTRLREYDPTEQNLNILLNRVLEKFDECKTENELLSEIKSYIFEAIPRMMELTDNEIDTLELPETFNLKLDDKVKTLWKRYSKSRFQNWKN